jgi:Uma2 family endonuclease
MVTLHLPIRESWTVDDLEGLPRELRYELHDGALLIMSPLTGWLRHVRRKLVNLLEAAGLHADLEVGVINAPGDTRVADIAIFRGAQREEDADLAHYPADRIHTVVEVVSPRSRKKDGDPQWYADRRIREYWVAQRIAGDTWNALITMSELVVTEGSGVAGYLETGRTTLADLLEGGYRPR